MDTGNLCDIATDGTRAFWTQCTWPYQIYAEGTGGTPTMLAQALANGVASTAAIDEHGSIAVDGPYVYYLEEGYMDRVPKAGGDAEPRALVGDNTSTQGAYTARIVGIDETHVYLHDTIAAKIYRVAK
jgi:hypothetical protein